MPRGGRSEGETSPFYFWGNARGSKSTKKTTDEDFSAVACANAVAARQSAVAKVVCPAFPYFFTWR